MYGDLSISFDRDDDNFAGVIYQQGRVSLDADTNAQTRITTEWQDIAGQDVIGAGVAAVPADLPDGFRIEDASLAAGTVTLTVHPGRVWADGILVRLDETPPIHRNATYLQPPVQDPPADTSTIAADVRDAVVLEVWREAVSAFQLPETLLEPALGGPDTTERLHTATAFRLWRLADDESCENLDLADDFDAKGKLTVTLQPTVTTAGDCPVEEGGGYTGFEHNLFRIEIAAVDPPASSPTMFKWSRFNGGLVGRAVFDGTAHRAAITANLQALTTSGLTGGYLETREYDPALGRWKVTYGAEVTLSGNEIVLPTTPTFGAVPAKTTSGGDPNPVFFRLWNGIERISDFPAGTPTELVDGIRLEFEADATGKYTPEDYWTFSVRAGGIGNPEKLIDDAPPTGIHYHRVPLATLTWQGSGTTTASIEDCRRLFHPLTRITTCCTYRVGDGIQSHGDFLTIKAAIEALPATGGEVCVLPGIYRESVVIEDRVGIRLHGCGPRSRIVGLAPVVEFGTADPVINIIDSAHIRVDNLAVEADDTGVGILVEATVSIDRGGGFPLTDIVLADLTVTAATGSAIEVDAGRFITIERCEVRMKDRASEWPGVFVIAQDVLIERNAIRVHPDDQITEGPIPSLVIEAGRGGLQLGGGCERVRVVDNLIQRGIGNGITLGSIETVTVDGGDITGIIAWVVDPDDPCDPCRPGNTAVPPSGGPDGDGGTRNVPGPPLRDIVIERNRIFDMGLNGIGVVGFFDLGVDFEFVSVLQLRILGNRIEGCLRRRLEAPSDAMRKSIGYGGIALAHVEDLVVRGNLIQDNGRTYLDPVCGIFVLFGEGVDVSGNRILNNGARVDEPVTSANLGQRGGIRIVYAVLQLSAFDEEPGAGPRHDGVPALTVHDNVVSSPLGPALAALALGPVSVNANQLTSRGIVPRRVSGEALAATVHLANLGTSRDFGELIPNFGGIRSFTLPKRPAPVDEGGEFFDTEEDFVRVELPSGIVLFTDNQCVLTSPPIPEEPSVSIMIQTLGDIEFVANQCEWLFAEGLAMVHALLLAASLRGCDSRLIEPPGRALFSAATIGLMNTTTDNQATHCLLIRGAPVLLVDSPNRSLVDAVSGEFCTRVKDAFAAVI